jgi:hypothetical protein
MAASTTFSHAASLVISSVLPSGVRMKNPI